MLGKCAVSQMRCQTRSGRVPCGRAAWRTLPNSRKRPDRPDLEGCLDQLAIRQGCCISNVLKLEVMELASWPVPVSTGSSRVRL